jgi:hypothetical protein
MKSSPDLPVQMSVGLTPSGATGWTDASTDAPATDDPATAGRCCPEVSGLVLARPIEKSTRSMKPLNSIAATSRRPLDVHLPFLVLMTSS